MLEVMPTSYGDWKEDEASAGVSRGLGGVKNVGISEQPERYTITISHSKASTDMRSKYRRCIVM